MKPYVLSSSLIPQTDVDLFEKVKAAVTALPDIVDLGKKENGHPVDLSCHILGRAVARVFGLKWVDGYLYPSFEHTWVLMPTGNIIDVYPVGVVGGPILIHGGQHFSPSTYHYKKKRISGGKFSQSSFRRAVRRTECLLLNGRL